MNKLTELVDYLQTVHVQYDLSKDNLEQRNYWNEEKVVVIAKIQTIADEWERMQWVSVKDKEPPKDGTCIWGFFPEKAGYFADQRYIPIHWSEWGGGTWDNTSSGHHISGSPTHWMLPNPPTNKGK